MINELSKLSAALRDAGVKTESWHQKYKEIPDIKPDAPCVRILLHKGSVYRLSAISSELGKAIRKYGDNQGTFPAMNIIPLYRITNEDEAGFISNLIKNNGAGADIEEIRRLCRSTNWNTNFLSKYKISIQDRAKELGEKTSHQYEPLNLLLESTKPLKDAEMLHQQLSDKALNMVSEGENVKLALQILFDTEKKEEEKKVRKLSVIFDCKELDDINIPSVSQGFTRGVNSALLTFSDTDPQSTELKEDAFGQMCVLPADPMPTVKLAAGFEVSLRTMFSGVPCQSRYRLFEGDAYPLSPDKRKELKSALDWLGREENENKTWLKTGKSESLFAYPSKLPDNDFDMVQLFGGTNEDRESDFIAVSKSFVDFIRETKRLDPDNYPEFVQLFALNKFDKARTRLQYSRITTPEEIIRCASDWQTAADNLPPLAILNKPKVLYPLEVPIVMNRVWKRNGQTASDKYRHTGRYHGLDLFYGASGQTVKEDLRELLRNSQSMATYAQTAFGASTKDDKSKFLHHLKQALSLMGMLLYRLDIRKDEYMNEYPYLLGQLLKISDAVHELYCQKVRDGQMPAQLAGSSLYNAMAEQPQRALVQLAARIQPYLSWCKANGNERKEWDGKDGKQQGSSAYYYISLYEKTADKIKKLGVECPVRFTDADKAQLFIGYLAAFEKKESSNPIDFAKEEKGDSENG